MNILNSIFSDSNLIEEITSRSRQKKLSNGDILIFPSEELAFVPIVISGLSSRQANKRNFNSVNYAEG